MLNLEKIRSKAIAFLKSNLLWLIIVAVVGFFFGHGCDGDQNTGTKVDAKKYESVVKELEAARDSIYEADSVRTIQRAKHRRENDSLTTLRDQARIEAHKAAQNASYWKGVVKQADQVNDKETGIAARDSQLVAVYSELSLTKRQLEFADSINARKDIDLALADAANTAKSELNDKYHVALDQVNADLQEKVKENDSLRKKAKKKKFWGGLWSGLKVGGAAAGGFIVGRAIK